MDDCHLLHMAINMSGLNLSLRTCEQLRVCALLELTEHYDFHRDFQVKGLLEASTMLQCIERRSSLEYALKLIPNSEFDEFIAIYAQTSDLSGINRIVNISQEKQMVFVLFESAYDDCHSYLKERAGLTVEEALGLFRQMVAIVHGLHQRGIVLNDLKLRKFLFADSTRTHLKLENLDGASSLKRMNTMNDLNAANSLNSANGLNSENGLNEGKRSYGCVLYQAPERLIDGDEGDGRRADCWSLGVILYTLLFGRYPFHHSNLEILKSQILAASFQMPQMSSELAPELRPLLSRLLCRCPEERLSTGEILDCLSGLQARRLGTLPEVKQECKSSRILSGRFSSGVESKSCDPMITNLSTLKAKSHSSSKEYFSKLSKLIKLTRATIECSTTITDDQLHLKLASAPTLPTVRYCLSSNGIVGHKDEK